MSARLLVQALRDPASLSPTCDWTGLIAAARAEQLISTLAFRLEGQAVPERVERLLAMHRADAERVRTQALWEAEMARRALAPLGVPVVLLKGTAFHAPGLEAAQGRNVGDLDILVPRAALRDVERALIAHGWERMKEADGYDDLYYRQWMHELPPLIHRERDRMADVHHTILPLTSRPKPDAEALIADSIVLPDGLRVLSPEDMIVHAAAHLIADGDMAGGLRNLWDIDRLLREFSRVEGFWPRLRERAEGHDLDRAVERAVRLSHHLFATPIPPSWRGWSSLDALFRRRLFARNGWGRATRPATRFGFYVRGHLLRMPPLMLARHLATKAWAQPGQSASSAPINSE
ncbi:MAG TPA: nucleotidyltransferase family protein [Allosphingosinicella sp.]